MNNLKALEVIQKAVASTSNEIEIGYNESLDFSVGASMLNRQASDKTIKVPALSLDEVLKTYHVDVCELLKVDCEGAEYDILLNTSKGTYARINHVVIELHDWVPKEIGVPNDLKAKLEQNGFKVKIRKNEILVASKA